MSSKERASEYSLEISSDMDVDDKPGELSGQIDCSSILCPHGFLDPLKGEEMKVLYTVRL